MQGKSGVGCSTALEQAFFGADLRTEMPLLTGLEKELDISGQGIRTASKQSRCARQHGGVHIVATSMHAAGVLRRELETRVFGHRQGVHVGSEKNTAAWRPSLQGRNKACRALTLLDPKPQVGQGLKHQSPSLGQIVAQFGFSMQCSTQFDDRGQYRLGITLEFIDPHHFRLPDWLPKVPDFLSVFNSSATLLRLIPSTGFRTASAL
jgi:hypothetical protein